MKDKRKKSKRIIHLHINGMDYDVLVEHRETLLEVLRGKLLLTGAKDACNQGECGACTVLMDGRSVLACLMLAIDAQGKDITTIEGLAKNGRLSPVQESFVESGAIQCGFCSPGMILTATALFMEKPQPSRDEIKKAIEGNICRCTGYNKIIDAIEGAAEKIRSRGFSDDNVDR